MLLSVSGSGLVVSARSGGGTHLVSRLKTTSPNGVRARRNEAGFFFFSFSMRGLPFLLQKVP